MDVKLNYLLGCIITAFIVFSISPTPIFAAQQIEKCIKSRWFNICIPIPPKPTPFPTPSIPPVPRHSPKPTSTPKPLAIGAALKNYTRPKGHDCDIKVPSQFSTIQAGINAAVNGQTVCVAAGTYNEDIELNKSIRLAGDGATNTSIINGLTEHCPCQGTVWILSDNVILEGFVINGAGSDYTNAAVHIAESVSGATVRNNRLVAGNGALAFLTDNAQHNSLIQNNILVGNNSPFVANVSQFDNNKPSNKVDFLNNTFIGSVSPINRQDTGITLNDGAPNSLINRNVFSTTGTINVLVASTLNNTINENNFNSNASVKVGGTIPINAENNWWGDTDPSDNAQSGVDFTPFALSPFAEN